MLNKNEIEQKLIEILISQDEKYKNLKISENSDLRADIGLNSVGMLYLVIVIEQTFGISFDNVGIGDFKTFGDIVNFILERQK